MSGTVDISRVPAWATLQPGDPWIFIEREPIRMGLTGPDAVAGNLIAWLPDDAPAGVELLFRILRIHAPHTYECVHLAQPPAYADRSHLDAEGRPLMLFGQPLIFQRSSP